MIYTFKVDELLRLSRGDAVVARILRLDILGQAADFRTKVLEQLKSAETKLTLAILKAIAKLTAFLKVSLPKHVEHVVSDIVSNTDRPWPCLSYLLTLLIFFLR